jgi:NADPH-dependent 2,4-dienoyl-CoA reductase/sulfur reductase-like enzyme
VSTTERGAVSTTERGAVSADELGRTSVANVFCAGEVAGIGGEGKSSVEGAIAGLCAAGRESDARKRLAQQRGQRAFARALARCYPPPAGWERVLESDTIVCRCEDVRWGALRDARDFRSAKLHTRVGMGACQGRVCGGALSILKGFNSGTAHPPLAPARLDTFTR